ncbi:ATP-binding protein [Mitsuaria sp. GD03876]|uniref:ATP-binding protein n=1 Tax=Mitsuaria sp. GD03876 TaxID=2975399 RepID=UPI00244B1030|nr:ATP-binding protein [Mitsuaria sp. GD03876]MDH0865836.1 ATP-binding protein [Mitsuaria sp. GD03876]
MATIRVAIVPAVVAVAAVVAVILPLFAAASPASTRSGDDIGLDATERAWIATHPTLRMAIIPDAPPLEYVTGGTARGLTVEYTRQLSLLTGLKIDHVAVATLPKRDMLRQGQADLTFAITFDEQASTSGGLSYQPMQIAGAMLVVSASGAPVVDTPAVLDGKRVMIPVGWPLRRELERFAPTATVVEAGPLSSLEAVDAGKADYALGSEIQFQPFLYRRMEGRLQIAGVFGNRMARVTAITREDAPVLTSIVRKALAAMPSDRSHEVYNRWLDTDSLDLPSASALGRHYAMEIAGVVLIVALLALLGLQANRQRLRARRNEREKAEFVAMVSHEIRSPMHAVLAAIELLSLTRLSAEQRHFVRLVDTGGKTLLHLVDDVLDASRIEAGRLPLTLAPVDLAALTADVAELHRLRAQANGTVLNVEFDAPAGGSSTLRVDGPRLSQVLHNLLSNAIKFTHGGTVRLCVALRPGTRSGLARVVIDVADTGVGISPEAQARLFKPYEQEAGAGRRAGGTGLGLSICRGLVDLMGGAISLSSKPGQGTTVSVTFEAEAVDPSAQPPLAATDDDTGHAAGGDRGYRGGSNAGAVTSAVSGVGGVTEPVDASRPPSAPRPRVLVIEDTPINQQALASQLRQLGCETTLAADGAAARGRFEDDAFALVLMDCDLPDTDGYTLAPMLRDAEQRLGRARTPIIAISAATGTTHVERCFAAGMDGVMSKPIRLGKLQSTLELWVDMPDPADRTGLIARTDGEGDRVPDAPPASAEADETAVGDAGHASEAEDALALDIEALRALAPLQDEDAVRHLAHRLHGAGLTLGWTALAAAAADVERQYSPGRQPDVAARQAALQILFKLWDAGHLR